MLRTITPKGKLRIWLLEGLLPKPKRPKRRDPQTYLTTAETARLLRVSEVTLARWRIEGQGPAFNKFGKRVLYARDDVLTWAKSQRRTSTSQETGQQW